MAKKRRVPEVLWRLFRDQPQTLAHTIISLMPQSSSSNLHCTGDVNPMSFLLRPDDPSDYLSLLENCFVVVNNRAPPLLDFSPVNRWSQKQIVARTIEMIMSEKPISPNVICSGFDRGKQSSRVVELLTCSAWDLLLQRVGDSVMVYILKSTSIFLPVSPKKHHQVTGPPITEKSFKLSKLRANPRSQLPSYVQFGPQKKRKRVDNVSSMLERQQASSSASVSVNSSTIGSVGCNGRSYLRQFSEHPKCKSGQTSCFGAATPSTGAVIDKYTDGELQQRSNQVNPRKRLRPFSWQRSRNRKGKYTKESSDRTPCTNTFTLDKSFRGRLHYDFKNRMQEKCSCLLMLQPSQLVSEKDRINRRPMFYSLECSSIVLPRKHILNSLKPNYADSQLLIANIFGLSDENVNAHSMPCSCGRGFCLIGSSCLYRSLVKLMKILIRRSQHCQHMRLLDKHCAVPSLDKRTMENSSSLLERKELREKGRGKSHGSSTKHCNKILDAGDSHVEAIKPYCSKNQVVSFIWAVCRSIIPSDLLGIPSNWRILRRNISKFIRLRRFEKFSTKHCMQNLKTSMLPFLSNKHSLCFLNAQVLKDATGQDAIMQKEFGKLKNAMHNLKYKLLTNWIFWFFSCLVVPLVQANFYVTESEHGKQDIYYYRKSVWEMLTNKAITCLKDKSYHHLDDADVRCIISSRPFGFSKLRLCPKENGVRMLSNLKASSKMLAVDSCLKDTCPGMKNTYIHHKRLKFDHFKSVNSVLRDTHAVLKGLLLKEPDKLGSSVFDYNDVYRKLCPFITGMKNGLTTIPDVFIVVSDVSKAFDSIDQDKLLDVMKDVVLEDSYLLERSHQVVCMKKSLSVHENLILMDHNIYPCYTRFTSSLTFPSLHSILVNQVQNRCVRREKILFLLNELVKRNVMQLNKKFYQQGIGIPQGSVLSSLLCSLYYGDLERNVIYPFLEKTQRSVIEVPSGNHNSGEDSRENTIISSPSNMLLRFIDDFIFISTSKEQATSFFYRLHRGFQDYNCYMNEEKFCVNFDIGNKSRFPSNRLYVGEDGISFLQWSGLLVNSSTLEVQGDYTRYLNNHLRSTLTVCWQGKPDHDLKKKLQCFVRPKCHPIFFDSNINSADVVRLNIYQVFLLCAMKFHCYVLELSSIWKLRTRSYLKIIERSLRYLHLLIKRRMQSVNLGSNFCPVLHLEEGEVEWLGLNAYVQVLKRKQSRHKELLSLLRCKLSAHRITGNVSCPLNYAIDKTHSSSIWKIKY
ncbi:hypothetical protein Ddye_030277 [Dipteronia dyeriana]|uniref:Telomerase reverse transcriptase n=1 Tax=Dipteronia dyeriana TaxID=168575 RepID=A0AAD9THB7_9ROSI|nr:hypothetical protein Ddye_030277 [Dipteronia dyeriana]